MSQATPTSDPEPFGGVWSVREYVFDPGGAFVGVVQQRRQVQQASSGRLRVIQDCRPGPELAGHPMGGFAGHHEFELSRDGHRRRYHGPAVVGTGFGWGEGAMTGHGLWPEFGYNFSSYAVLVAPDRQLTGGTFSCAGNPVAHIVGVACPKGPKTPAPRLSGSHWPGDRAATWTGQRRVVTAEGTVLREVSVRRHYTREGWSEVSDDHEGTMTLASARFGQRIRGTVAGHEIDGLARRCGWALEIEAVDGPPRTLRALELHDAGCGHLVSLRRWFCDGQPQQVEVLHLRPDPVAPSTDVVGAPKDLDP